MSALLSVAVKPIFLQVVVGAKTRRGGEHRRGRVPKPS